MTTSLRSDAPDLAVTVLKRQRARHPDAGDEDRVFPMVNHADAWADFQTIKGMAGITSDLTIHDLRASRVTQWHIEPDKNGKTKTEAELAAIIGSKDVKGLIRVYVRDSASEEEKRARVNAADDEELVYTHASARRARNSGRSVRWPRGRTPADAGLRPRCPDP